jgi:hypothetical protein
VKTAIRRHGSLRLFEGGALVLIGLVLAAAGVVDAVRVVRLDRRANAAKSAFTSYEAAAGRPAAYNRMTVRIGGRYDTVCGRPRNGKRTPLLCLQVHEAKGDQPAFVAGGYRLPRHGRDVKWKRFGCFGRAADRACPTSRPARPPLRARSPS